MRWEALSSYQIRQQRELPGAWHSVKANSGEVSYAYSPSVKISTLALSLSQPSDSNTCTLKADSHIACPSQCHAHAVPLPCRAAKGLECVFPILFTQCGLVMPMPSSDHAVLLKATAQHGRLSTAVLCRGLEKNGMVRAWYRHGMASVNQTRPQCVNQMGKTHSKPLATWQGRGTAWARHGHGSESALISLILLLKNFC